MFMSCEIQYNKYNTCSCPVEYNIINKYMFMSCGLLFFQRHLYHLDFQFLTMCGCLMKVIPETCHAD